MIKITKDGRTIRTGEDYTEFRRGIYVCQDGLCSRCRRGTSLKHPLEWDNSFHVHHGNGRGMGGSKRDDMQEVCTGLCGGCHRKEHNQ